MSGAVAPSRSPMRLRTRSRTVAATPPSSGSWETRSSYPFPTPPSTRGQSSDSHSSRTDSRSRGNSPGCHSAVNTYAQSSTCQPPRTTARSPRTSWSRAVAFPLHRPAIRRRSCCSCAGDRGRYPPSADPVRRASRPRALEHHPKGQRCRPTGRRSPSLVARVPHRRPPGRERPA